LFKSEQIVVNNNNFYEDDTIIQLSEVGVGENIFIASMFGNSKNISDNLPYVKQAKIGFEIPDKIVIDIENESPSSSLKTDGGFYLVSDEGRILEKVSKRPKDLMFINAPKLKSTEIGEQVEFEDKSYTDAMLDINESISSHSYSDITGINIKRISNITITYDNRIVIKIGMPEKVDYKLRTAFTIIKEKLDPNNARTIRGILNVSNVTETKKSYFTEITADGDDDEIETSPNEQEATENTTVRTNFIATEAETATEATDPNQYFTEAPADNGANE
jgi:cell division septal protein FtsQ